jgi:transposase-like protein
MAQHFLLSPQAKTLSLASVFQMKDEAAEMAFRRIRWHETDGQPVCPHCGGVDAYDCRRLKGAPRFRCRACVKDFSITSGTLFASHKLPLRCYLAAIAIFCNEVKGKSALALSRDLCVSYKCAFVLLHKLREAMAAELKGRILAARARLPRSIRDISAGTSSRPILPRSARIVASPPTNPASARRSSSSASATAILCRPCSVPKGKRLISSARALPRAPWSMPTSRPLGTIYMPALK